MIKTIVFATFLTLTSNAYLTTVSMDQIQSMQQRTIVTEIFTIESVNNNNYVAVNVKNNPDKPELHFTMEDMETIETLQIGDTVTAEYEVLPNESEDKFLSVSKVKSK